MHNTPICEKWHIFFDGVLGKLVIAEKAMTYHDPHIEQKQKECLELYLKYGGRDHNLIEREMRQRGWPRFSRRILHNRNHRGRHEPGWIDKLGWRDKLIEQFLATIGAAMTGAASIPACEAGSSGLRPWQGINSRETARHNAGGTGVGKRYACGPVFPNSPPFEGGVAAASADGVVLCAGEETCEVSTNSIEANLENHPVRPERRPPLLRKEGSLKAPVDAVNAFHAWIKRVSPNFDWDAPHHKYLCEQLERVSRGECKRLIINIPPRHGKSELVTVRYSAWRMKEDPATKVIIASYGQKLASRFSRGVRRMLSDDWAIGKLETGAASATTTGAASTLACDAGSSGVNNWSAGILPASENPSRPYSEAVTTASANNNTVTLTSSSGFITNGCGSTLTDPNRHNAGGTGVASKGACTPVEDENPFPFIKARLKNTESEWETTKGGGLRAVGVGGGVTGFGADLVIIDDPIKSRAEAESKNKREAVWDWFNDDIYTRLEPDGAIILIQTRWHEDDLAGRLIKNMNEEDGEHWEVINLPAIAMATGAASILACETTTGAASTLACEAGSSGLTPQPGIKPLETERVNAGGTGVASRDARRSSHAGGTGIAKRVPHGPVNGEPDAHVPVKKPFKPRVIGFPRLYSHLNDAHEKTGAASIPACEAGSSGLTPQHEINSRQIERHSAGGTGVASRDARRSSHRSPVTPLLLHSSSPHLGRDPLDRVPGDALWPKRYPITKLEKTQYQIGTYSFSSLYQQEPVPREGGMFKREWFGRIISAAPEGLRWVRGYDLGVTANATSDYTASLRVAFDKDENMYIDGGYRRRIEFPEQRRYILERIAAERNTEHCVEGTQNGVAVVQELLKYRPRLSRILRYLRVSDPKTARAIPWINIAEQGRLCLIRGPWNEEFIDEACSFPLGTHDDQVDAVSLAVKASRREKYGLYLFP